MNRTQGLHIFSLMLPQLIYESCWQCHCNVMRPTNAHALTPPQPTTTLKHKHKHSSTHHHMHASLTNHNHLFILHLLIPPTQPTYNNEYSLSVCQQKHPIHQPINTVTTLPHLPLHTFNQQHLGFISPLYSFGCLVLLPLHLICNKTSTSSTFPTTNQTRKEKSKELRNPLLCCTCIQSRKQQHYELSS